MGMSPEHKWRRKHSDSISLLWVWGTIGDQLKRIVLDTGSKASLIDVKTIQQLGYLQNLEFSDKVLHAANETDIKTMGTIRLPVSLVVPSWVSRRSANQR